MTRAQREKLARIRAQIEARAAELDDKDALEVVDMFPKWSGAGISYETDQRLRHDGILYRVLQPHTSQPGWTPDAAPSLFARVLIPDPEVIPDWEQPGSTNPYMKGDKVKHNGKVWISTVDNNVWEPGTVGAPWDEVTE